MKFVISRNELSNLIRKIQNIVPQTPPIPILSHFLIEAVDDELVITATDLTVGIRCSSKAKVLENGSLAIPSKKFCQLVKELTVANIEVNSQPNQMAEITAGASHFRLNGMGKNAYPELPDLDQAAQFKIGAELLKQMLSRCAFAVSKEDNRYALTGVLMHIGEGKATFVGTDGKRLSKTETPINLAPSLENFSGSYILPIKAVDEILKTIGDKEDLTVFLTTDKVAVQSETTLIITKLLAGDYPDFSPLTNSKAAHLLILHREELISLLRQISLFTTEDFQSVRFTFETGELIVTANTSEVGEGKVSMPVNYSGSRLEIAFHPIFFLDILRHCTDETVSLGISDSYNPGIITDSTSSLFIIMPMRLNE